MRLTRLGGGCPAGVEETGKRLYIGLCLSEANQTGRGLPGRFGDCTDAMYRPLCLGGKVSGPGRRKVRWIVGSRDRPSSETQTLIL